MFEPAGKFLEEAAARKNRFAVLNSRNPAGAEAVTVISQRFDIIIIGLLSPGEESSREKNAKLAKSSGRSLCGIPDLTWPPNTHVPNLSLGCERVLPHFFQI